MLYSGSGSVSMCKDSMNAAVANRKKLMGLHLLIALCQQTHAQAQQGIRELAMPNNHLMITSLQVNTSQAAHSPTLKSVSLF